MSDREMPDSWRDNARRRSSGGGRPAAPAEGEGAGGERGAPDGVDELARKRSARRAAEEARRRATEPPPPGPQAC